MNGWLWAATGLRILALLAALVFVLASYAADPRMLVLLGALVVAHVVAVRMFEHDPVHQRTPSRWTVTSMGTGLLAGISAGLALVPAVRNLAVGVADAVVLPAGLVVAAAVVGCTELAARRVTTPGLPELGGTELRLLFMIRNPGAGWGGNANIALIETDHLLLQAFQGRPGAFNAASSVRVPLLSVQAVSVRIAGPTEPPWAKLPMGWAAPTPPGPVVQVDWTPPGAAPVVSVAPAARADDLAAVLRYRVWALTGRATGDRPLGRPTPAPPERGPAPPPLPAGSPSAAAGWPPQVAVLPGPAAPVWPGPSIVGDPAVGIPTAVSAGTSSTPAPPAVCWAAGALGVLGLPLLVALLAAGSGRPLVVGVIGVLLAGTGWLLARARPRWWPAWAAAAGVLVVAATLPQVPYGVLIVAAGVGLAWWAGRQLGALTPAQADTATVLALPLTAGGGLQIHSDRLVLRPDYPNRRGGNLRQDLHLGELVLLQPGTLAVPGPVWWPLPGERELQLPPAPALRIAGGGQQWLIPWPDPALLARVIGGRARRARRGRVPIGPQDWAAVQQRARRLASGSSPGVNGGRTSVLQNSAWRWIRVAAPFTLVWLALAASLAAQARPGDVGAAAIPLVIAALGASGVAWGAGIERRLRPAEDNPLPPGAPPWGEQRPNHPPLAGWRPWPMA